jgi:biopolymer transport protein ExbB
MKARTGPVVLIALGVLLLLGPLGGLIGTMSGMIRAFERMSTSGATPPDRLAADIERSLLSTSVGLALGVVGVAMLAGGIVWLLRSRRAGMAHDRGAEGPRE